MNKRINTSDISSKRLIDISELCSYIGMGKTLARSYADSIGATKRYGKRVLFDKYVIDKAISQEGTSL